MKQRPKYQHELGLESAIQRRPHHVAPALSSVHLIMVDKQAGAQSSSGGIAVASNCTTKVLRRAGVNVDSWFINNAQALLNRLDQEEYRTAWPVTHVVLHSPSWEPENIRMLAERHTNIEFIQLNHSGSAYLSINDEGAGITRIRKTLALQTEMGNVRVAANNQRVMKMFYDVYRQDCLYLPNLYYWETLPHARSRRDFDPLRVGSFGVGRDWKNQEVACQAAMAMANQLDVQLELHVNIDPWGTYKRVRNGRQNYIRGLSNARLIEHKWSSWTDFRELVRSMDILLSPSYDETFCMACADGIVEGVPTVAGDALEWVPRTWCCREPFNHASVAAVGMSLLLNRISAVNDGREALTSYVDAGTQTWISYLVQ